MNGEATPRWIDYHENYRDALDNWARERGTIFHTGDWLDALQKSFGYKTQSQLLLDRQGKIDGVLPLCIGRNLQGRRVGVALPFVHYLKPCSINENASTALAAHCARLRQRLNLHYLELRLNSPLPDNAPAGLNAQNVTFVLPLQKGYARILAGFSPDHRRRAKLVREAARFDVSFDVAHLAAFHGVFLCRQKQLGTPAPALRFFHTIHENLPGRVTLLTALDRQTKKVVGGMFLLRGGKTLYYHWGATLIEYNALHLNHFMYGEAVRFAVENGFEYFDMGRSPIPKPDGPMRGTYRFKAQFGATPTPLFYYRFCKRPQAWAGTSDQMLAMAELWKKIPASLANAAGHYIIGKAMP